MISIEDFLICVDDALDGMVQIVEELGDDLANRRPDLPGANSPYVVLTHCLGVVAYWAGEMVAGRNVNRDGDAEVRAAGSVAGLVERTRAAQRQLRSDVATADPYAAPRGARDPEDVNLPLWRTQ